MKNKIPTIMAAAVLLTAAMASAQILVPFDDPSSVPRGRPNEADANKRIDTAAFLQFAYSNNKIEIQQGELASSRSSSPAVKELAQTLIKDHKAANAKVTALASKKSVDLSRSLTGDQQAKVDELSGLSAAAFDKQYLTTQMSQHEEAIAFFEKTAALSADADVKMFAEETLPLLRKHQQMVRDSGVGIGVTAATSSSSPAP